MSTVVEVEAKINRIRELTILGFNTPKMFYVSPIALKEVIDDAMKWCEETGHPIFNVRTYTYNPTTKAEGHTSPHYTDIPIKELRNIVNHLKGRFACMIDAEIPDNGRVAGNVMLELDYKGIVKELTIEYCLKEKRAMVRNHDKSITIARKEIETLPIILRQVAEKAITFTKPCILEWTYFSEPAGIRNEPLVWWEYRRI